MRKQAIKNSCLAESDEHFRKLGLARGVVSQWEDGLRTDGGKGTYEWWYADFSFPDGTKLVLTYYTKMPVLVNTGMKPTATMELTTPDGRRLEETVAADANEAFYSKERCCVRIGGCSIEGDLKDYKLVFGGKELFAEVKLSGTIPSFRPQTGTMYFGDDDEHEFSWLAAVPEGEAEAFISYEGKSFQLKGSGYHDHNWGNPSMFELIHHWYWGRAKIGDYKVIASWITAEEEYGFNEFKIFMLARGSEILGDNSNHTLRFVPSDEYVDPHTGKPVFGKVVYEYEAPDGDFYRVTFDRKEDINSAFFYEALPKPLWPFARLVGFKNSYQRFQGSATVEHLVDGKIVDSATEESAFWELMYFGRAGADVH